MNELHLFAGAGGGILAGQLLGHRCVCAVEWEPYAQTVLVARQNDGCFPPFPIWDDVQTFDGRPWRGIVDVVAGGFPCQDISVAGGGAGITGERSGMWKHMARIVGEVRPRYVFVENSPALITRGLGTVLSDLAALGYDCRWTVLGAADVGAPHQRDRFWLVGHAVGKRFDAGRDDHREHDGHLFGAADEHAAPLAYADNAGQRASARGGCCGKCIASGHDAGRCSEAVADASCPRGKSKSEATNRGNEGNASQPLHCGSDLADAYGTNLEGGGHRYDAQGWKESFRHVGLAGGISDWWEAEPSVGRVAHGVAGRVDRLKAIGNGQVPLCAATAWRLLNGH